MCSVRRFVLSSWRRNSNCNKVNLEKHAAQPRTFSVEGGGGGGGGGEGKKRKNQCSIKSSLEKSRV